MWTYISVSGCGKGYYPIMNLLLHLVPNVPWENTKIQQDEVNELNAHHIVQPMPKDRHQLMLVVSERTNENEKIYIQQATSWSLQLQNN